MSEHARSILVPEHGARVSLNGALKNDPFASGYMFNSA